MKTIEQYNELLQAVLVKYHNNLQISNNFFGSPEQWKVVVADLQTNTLGVCSLARREIRLNRKFFEQGSEKQIDETFYHEIAHALAGIEYSRTGRVIAHGALWRSYMRSLGYFDAKAKTSFKDEEKPEYLAQSDKKELYKIVYIDTKSNKVEVLSGCNRKLKNLSKRMVSGRRETLGNLYLVPTARLSNYDNVNMVLRHAFQ